MLSTSAPRLATAPLTSCPPLENTPPASRTAAEHATVLDWLTLHCSKFVTSLAPDPVNRANHLALLACHARLFECAPNQPVCIQGETCDSVFIVFSGSVEVFFDVNADALKSASQTGNISSRGRGLLKEKSVRMGSTDSSYGTFFTSLSPGDYFGEPDYACHGSSLYPFTARARHVRGLEADMLGMGSRGVGNEMDRLPERSYRAACNAEAMHEKQRASHQNNHRPRIIAIPAAACRGYLADNAMKGKRVYGLWDRARVLESNAILSTLGRASLYMLAMKAEERVVTGGGVVVGRDEKVGDAVWFVLEGEVHYAIVDCHTKAHTRLMRVGPLGIFGDVASSVREAELAITKKMRDSGEKSVGELQQDALKDAMADAERGERGKQHSKLVRRISRKTMGIKQKNIFGQIDEVNSMVVVRELGQLPGTVGAEEEKRRVSKYHVIASPSVRYLAIHIAAFGEIVSLSSERKSDLVLQKLLEMVTKQSKWIDTQLHMAAHATDHVASGAKLWDQQAGFMSCDRCQDVNCHSMKPACISKQKAAMKEKDASEIRSVQSKSGYMRLQGTLRTADHGAFSVDEDKFDARGECELPLSESAAFRINASVAAGKSAEERTVQDAEKQAARRGAGRRRGSLETLFDIFRGKGADAAGEEEVDQAPNALLSPGMDRESLNTRTVLQNQKTIKQMAQAKASAKIIKSGHGKPKTARRGSITSMAKNLFSMFD